MIKPNIPLQGPKVSVLSEFVNFIKKYGVVGLAIGVVMGQAVNSLVQSIVNNLVNPILGKILGRVQLSDIAPYGIKIGAFLNDFINFLAITFVVYISIRFFIVYLLTDEEKEKFDLLKKEEAPETIHEITEDPTDNVSESELKTAKTANQVVKNKASRPR